MADLSNASFIPKQNPTKIKRQTATRQVYFLTLISYVLIIAALIASVAVFFYERYSQSTLVNEIKGLNDDVANFKQSDMDMVSELDERLLATKKVVAGNISMPAVLAVLELSTIASMQFLDTTITHKDDNTIVLEANITTDSFDSVLFQREIYKKAATLAGVELTGVAITLAEEGSADAKVALEATFAVPANSVLYTPASNTPVITMPTPTATSSANLASSSTPRPPQPVTPVTAPPQTVPTVPTTMPPMPPGLPGNGL